MPRIAENSSVKKEITKIKNCTKKYRKAVRKYYKTSDNLGKYRGTDSKKRTALFVKTQKANKKADDVKHECEINRGNLKLMMREEMVVKEKTKDTIAKIFAKLDKDELEWSSNTSSFVSQLNN